MTKRFRARVGHYGGLYADVPAEFFHKFRTYFPKKELPRGIKMKSVAETLTPQGAARFYKAHRQSHGTYFEAYFANLAKGTKRLERLIDIERKKGYEPFEDVW